MPIHIHPRAALTSAVACRFCLLDAAWATKKPDNISMEEAATLSVAFDTAALVLFGPGGLELDGTPTSPVGGSAAVLLWGGATTVGLAAVQLASQAGYTVITTASKRNHALLKSLGATHVIDYHDDDHLEQLRALAKQYNLLYGADLVGAATAATTASLLTAATADHHGRLTVIAALPEAPTENVDYSFTNLGGAYGVPAAAAFLRSFTDDIVVPGLSKGSLRPLPLRILQGTRTCG